MAAGIGGDEVAPPTGGGPAVKTTYDLMLEAGDAAKARGHRMSIFTAVLRPPRTVMRSVCHECEAYVDVAASPLPNEVAVGGTAVALDCPGYPEDVRSRSDRPGDFEHARGCAYGRGEEFWHKTASCVARFAVAQTACPECRGPMKEAPGNTPNRV